MFEDLTTFQCADRPNCGEIFRAYSDGDAQAVFCPYCSESVRRLEP